MRDLTVGKFGAEAVDWEQIVRVVRRENFTRGENGLGVLVRLVRTLIVQRIGLCGVTKIGMLSEDLVPNKNDLNSIYIYI